MDYDALITRSLTGRLSDQVEVILREWREADPANEDRYQALAAVWRATRDHEEPVATVAPTLETITSEAQRRRRGHGVWKWWFRQVAVVAAGFIAGVAFADLWIPDSLGTQAAGEIVTGEGETATARLDDGTVIRLAPESRLVLPSPSERRNVILDGRAFFAVAEDPGTPFLVRTPSGDARVLGTRFELNARDGQLRLVVVEGRVSVTSGGREMDVRTRQVTHLRQGEVPSVVEVEDVWPLLGWMGRFLAFESTPLREVRTELERRFGVALVFEDPSLAEETVTVWFGDEPIEEVVSVLCRLMESRCTMDSSRVRMSRTTPEGAAAEVDRPRNAL